MRFALGVQARGLAPVRGGRVVASGASFALGPGDALVLRGPNGSGKSSILRAVAGLCGHEGEVAFTEGAAARDPGAVRAHALHLLAGGGGLVRKLTCAEHVRFWAALYGVAPGGALARVGLEEPDRPAGALSTGQRRRLGLARLLMAPRPAWLLDEPLSGLDADGAALLLDAVTEHRAAGGVVLLATHGAERLDGAPTLRLAA